MTLRVLPLFFVLCGFAIHAALPQDRSPLPPSEVVIHPKKPCPIIPPNATTHTEKSLYKRKSEWKKIIDQFWGSGDPYQHKLNVFDTYASYVRAKCPTFVYSRLNWDSVATYWRSKITDSTSRGAFNAIIMKLSYALNDLHAWAADNVVVSSPLTPSTPYVSLPWDNHDVRYFGAALTLLPDSSLLVYKVVPNHPLGLQPGDRVLGYEGIPWHRLANELIEGDVATELLIGGAPSSEFYHRMVWAGMCWHLFDTIDVVRYGTGQVLHLSTLPLASLASTAPLLQTDQLPVPGVTMPSDNLVASDVSSGIVSGTNIGYIYVYHHRDPKISVQFEAAVHALENTDGLIIDLRTDLGGKYGPERGIARLVDFGDSTLVSMRRSTASDLLTNVPATTLDFTIPMDVGTAYHRPIAVLIGPNCVSYGDASAWELTYVPNVRFFGRSTMGAFSGRYWSDGPSIAGYYLNSPDIVIVDHRSPGSQLWAREFPVDEEVWLTADEVAKGEDGVFKRALAWMATVGTARSTEIPAKFELLQNYPNPFNPSTTISYALPQRSHVTLTVFNTLGQQVATLVNGEMEAGNHKVTLDATGLASGICFCTLRAGEFRETRRMILLR